MLGFGTVDREGPTTLRELEPLAGVAVEVGWADELQCVCECVRC